MIRFRIALDTKSDILDFVNECSKFDKDVFVEDSKGHCVSGKSLLGMLYTMEWNELYCRTEATDTGNLYKFAV